jgi:hypothetical protein
LSGICSLRKITFWCDLSNKIFKNMRLKTSRNHVTYFFHIDMLFSEPPGTSHSWSQMNNENVLYLLEKVSAARFCPFLRLFEFYTKK